MSHLKCLGSSQSRVTSLGALELNWNHYLSVFGQLYTLELLKKTLMLQGREHTDTRLSPKLPLLMCVLAQTKFLN